MSEMFLPAALVTGGSKGIGMGIVVALLEGGFRVFVADIIEPQLPDDFPADFHKKVHFMRADISHSDQRDAIIHFCRSESPQLDLLVNNAGISVPQRGDMLQGSEETLDRLLSVNLKGPYFLTRLAALWMIDRIKSGDQSYKPKIINIASLASYASANQLAEYALSKSAVSMMTKLYADRLAEYGICVYEIRPGIVATDMTKPSKAKYDKFIEQGGLPLKRWGLPEDVGKLVKGIAAGMLPYSTGEVINVDGGFHLRRL
jgi:3-oxoacyl-[acyl-carrier protein] reductase